MKNREQTMTMGALAELNRISRRKVRGLMIGALMIASIVAWTPPAFAQSGWDAGAQSCTPSGWTWGQKGVNGSIVGNGNTAMNPQGTTCNDRWTSKVEVWIWNKPTPRSCSPGFFDSSRGACVHQVRGAAQAGESYADYGVWDVQSHHLMIDNWSSGFPTYTSNDDSTDYTDGGDAPSNGGGGDGVCEPDVPCEVQGGNGPGTSSPILIPLTNMQAFKLTSATDGVYFDLNADGMPERTSWTAADSRLAFLALDRNENGIIDNGSELFGDHTLPGSWNGFAALAQTLLAMGGAKAGAVRAGDPLYDKLLLWEDRDHDGYSDPDELRPAKEILTQIGLGYSQHRRRDGHGNLFRYRGWAEIRTAGPGQGRSSTIVESDARRRDIYDVFFVR